MTWNEMDPVVTADKLIGDIPDTYDWPHREARYRSAYDKAGGVTEPSTDGHSYAEETFQRFLTRLVHDSPTPRHTIARLRGVQAGFLLHGYWLTPPSAGTLRGPGATSTPVTTAVADSIRAQVAHPVVAAGVAISLFTGLPAASLRGLPAIAVHTAARYLTISVRVNARGHAAIGRTSAKSWTRDITFYIPPAARLLLRAARAYLSDDRDDLLVFGSAATSPSRIAEAADRCGLRLHGEPIELTTCWPLRTAWHRIGESAHSPLHDQRPAASASRSCLTAVSAADVTIEPPYGRPRERMSGRWAPHGPPPADVAELVRAYLAGEEPRLSPLPAPRPGAQPPLDEWHRRYILVERHLAVRLPPTANHHDRIMLHPDIAFALRLTDRPAADSSVR